MNNSELIKSRWGIGLNFMSVFLIIVFMEWVNRFDIEFHFYISMVLFLLIVFWAISFYRIYWKSRWWKYFYQKADKYDERETKVIGEAMRKAYTTFVIGVGLILLFYTLMEWSINGLIVFILISTAHILPASILKWQGYEI